MIRVVTGVLLAEGDFEMLRTEVFEYTKELWGQTASMFEEHLAMPIDKFKSWFEAVGDYTVRMQNVKLKAKVAELEKQIMEAKRMTKDQEPFEVLSRRIVEADARKAEEEKLSVLIEGITEAVE